MIEETQEKLHPALASFLEALKAYGEERRSGSLSAELRLFTSLLFIIKSQLRFWPTDSFPRTEKHLNFMPQPQQAFVSTETGITLARFHKPTATKLRDFCWQTHCNASPEAKVFTGSMWKELKSLRSNRDRQPVLEKFSHEIILAFLFLFGALKRTGSDLSRGVLTHKELKEVFDYACPICPENHSSEALRKSASKFVKRTLRQWPTTKMSGTRSPSCTVEIRHTGLVPMAQLSPRRPQPI